MLIIIIIFIYIAVDIWLEYIQFSIGGMNETDGINNVRSICERAIQFAGLHITKGNILWEAYREFETALLSGYQVKLHQKNLKFF